MVLVLDVARFKYPSYVTSYINLNPTHQYNHVMKWVSLDTLWDSLHPLDGSTQKPRGYVILSKGSRAYLKSAMSHLSLNTSSWPKLAEIMFRQLPEKCSALPDNYSMSEFLSLVISLIPDEYDSLVEDRLPLFTPSYIQRGLDGLPPDSSDLLESDGLKEYLTGLDKLLEQVSSTSLYHLVSKSFALKRKMERIASMSSLILPLHESRSNSPFPSDINTTPTFQALERVRTSSLTDRSVDRSPLMESRQNSLSGYPPSPGIPAVNRLLVFSSVLNRRESFAEILPPPVNVNEFTAFMTMFLFALFAYHPLIDKLSSSRPKEMRTVFDVSKLPEPLSTEVQLLKDQMFALTECCQKCHAC